MVLDTWDLECVFPLAQADFPAHIDSLARRTPQRHSTPAGVLLFNLPLQQIPLVQGEEEEEALPNPIPLLLQTLRHNLSIIIVVVVEEEQEQEAREALPIPLEEEDVPRGVVDHEVLFRHSQKKKQPSTPQTTVMVKHKLTILVRDYQQQQQQQQFQDGQLPLHFLLQTIPTTLATATHPTTQPSLFSFLIITLP